MSDKKAKRTTTGNVKIFVEFEAKNDVPGYEAKPLKEIASGIQPISYEDELIQRRTEIIRDPLSDMLLFPEDDITAYKVPRELRTEYSSVPALAIREANSLFVKECIRAYTCDWYIIENQYELYSGSYHRLPCKPRVQDRLRSQIFEIDAEREETDGGQVSNLVPTKEKGIFKEGYLTKSPFHTDGNPIFGSKTYKRRWFTLKQVSNDGSYVLEYKKDEVSTMAKGTLYLDSCTQITKGLKGRMHGFELHIQDKVYGLAADSTSEMERWVVCLCKATGIDIEQDRPLRSLFGGRRNAPKHSNLKDSLKHSSHPLLLEYAKETDNLNAKRRLENRVKIFSIYPDISNQYSVTDIVEEDVPPYREKFGTRFLVALEDLKFKLAVQCESEGTSVNCEPFFTTLCVFDTKEGRKLSEDFVCDLNHPTVKEMLVPDKDENGGNSIPSQIEKDHAELVYPKKAVFSITSPHSDIYLVARITKVLQGGISQCAEPYNKSSENVKGAQKIQRQARLACKRLGKYTMPFGWTMRPIFKDVGTEIDTESEFSSIFKQETAKLSDEDILKLIQDVKGEKSKQQVIAGTLTGKLSGLNPNHPNCYTPSLIPVKPFTRAHEISTSIEVQEFVAETAEAATPFPSYMNHFYVYPLSINYSSQKTFSKARNIACTIEFKDKDGISSKPLRCIYSKSGSCTLTTEVTTPVLHHNTSPSYYEEIKVLLPTHLHEKHHILFTFYHVSVEQPKTEGAAIKKKHDLESPIGFAWMPILEESGIVRDDKSQLPVASFLTEGYLQSQSLGFGKFSGPSVKWVDGKGASLFRCNTKLVSTIYTQDLHITNFFAHWQSSSDKTGSDVETSRLLKLMHAVEVTTVIKFLPVILGQLFEVLVTVQNDDVAVNVVRVFIRIVTQIQEVHKEDLLKSYVKYIFRIEDNHRKTVHEELAKHLVFYLKHGGDPHMIDSILQGSWFFFDVIVKSMAQFHLTNDPEGHHSSGRGFFDSRDARFSSAYHQNLEKLLQMFVLQLVNKARDKPQIAKDANFCVAGFIKKSFTHMDRGFVFQMVNYVKDQFRSPDPQMFALKFDFLRAVAEHEHYVALNLPFDIRALGGVHESTLNDVYCKKHFLVGLVLKEIAAAMNEGKVVRKYAIRLLRNLLVKHEFDDRHQLQEKQARIAALYIPFLTSMLEHSLRFHKNLDRPFFDDSLLSTRHAVATPVGGKASPSISARSSMVSGASSNPTSVLSLDPSGRQTPVQTFDEDERKELLLCFLGILKNLTPGIIVDWWRDILTTAVKKSHWLPTALYYVHQDKSFAKFVAVIDFFDLLECCMEDFKYCGKKVLEDRSRSPTSESTKQFLEEKYQTTPPSAPRPRPSPRMGSGGHHHRSYSNGQTANMIIKGNTSPVVSPVPVIPDIDIDKRILLESNLANEVACVVLDQIELFCTHFKFHLEQDDGDNILLKKIFNVLMSFLRIGQSEFVLRHVFATLRSFIHKFPAALFKGSANLCGVLCFEILKLCNSKLESVRSQACCFMYLLMRGNYEYSGTGCVRVHLQVIVAVSKLIASGMNRASMNNSLVTLKNYAVEDKGLKSTEFPSEVRDLIKKVHTVLQATAQMKEHEDDSEVLVDLQYSLAKSYSSTPELRQTWLHSMAQIHERNANFSEAAMCYVHAAALVAEYLKRKGCYTAGCAAFKNVSPNVVPDECVMKDDEGTSGEQRYTTKHLIELLETSAERLKRAERYEVMGEVFKLAIPLYEEERNFRCLAVAYSTLKEAYDKVVEVMASGKRLLGRYYRVAFFGRSFNDDDGKEFIYKEPKLTSLPEITDRLLQKYQMKHGNVKIIQDSSKVKTEELNPAVNYIQITFVQPYFDEEEFITKPTDFERENNIRRFVFETPFTLSGKSHGELSEQHKRKTILTTSHCFPYVKKRILVVQQEMYELVPLEVAIDEMQVRLKELNQVITLDPPDMKKLQLKLQGSVSVQVNAGPLAYAKTFLDTAFVREYPAKHVEALQQVYKDFVRSCGKALDLNDILIKSDQRMYQDDLKEKYQDLKERLGPFVGDLNNNEGTTIPGFGAAMDSDV